MAKRAREADEVDILIVVLETEKRKMTDGAIENGEA